MKRFFNAFVFDMVAVIALVFAFSFILSAVYFTYLAVENGNINVNNGTLLLAFYGMGMLFFEFWILLGYVNFTSK